MTRRTIQPGGLAFSAALLGAAVLLYPVAPAQACSCAPTGQVWPLAATGAYPVDGWLLWTDGFIGDESREHISVAPLREPNPVPLEWRELHRGVWAFRPTEGWDDSTRYAVSLHLGTALEIVTRSDVPPPEDIQATVSNLRIVRGREDQGGSCIDGGPLFRFDFAAAAGFERGATLVWNWAQDSEAPQAPSGIQLQPPGPGCTLLGASICDTSLPPPLVGAAQCLQFARLRWDLSEGPRSEPACTDGEVEEISLFESEVSCDPPKEDSGGGGCASATTPAAWPAVALLLALRPSRRRRRAPSPARRRR